MLGVSPHMAHELLGGCVEQGQALVERAGFVGDLRDYESWKAARNEWIARTAEALAQVYPGSDDAERFRSAASTTGGGRWQMDYTFDLECARAAMDMVASLRDALRPGGDPADSEIGHQPSADSGAGAEQPGASESGQEQPSAPEAGQEQSTGSGAAPEQAQREQWQGKSGESRPAEQEPARSEPEQEPARSEVEQEQAGASEPASPASAGSGPALVPVSGERGPQEPVGGNELLAPSANGSASPMPTTTPAGRKVDHSRQVFLVHGRNEKVRQAVDRLLGQAGQHEVTILNERPNDRRMLVERFEHEPAGTRYAIVLLTADDVGAPRLDSEQEPYYSPRARQGVVFEMGFLVAALSPRCVCVLYEDGVELPCDLEGIAYIRLDLAGTWRPKLLLALRSAGFDYDLNSLAPA